MALAEDPSTLLGGKTSHGFYSAWEITNFVCALIPAFAALICVVICVTS